jgi:hypothetical protein
MNPIFLAIKMADKVSSKGKGSQFSKWEPNIFLKSLRRNIFGIFLLMIPEGPGHKNAFL